MSNQNKQKFYGPENPSDIILEDISETNNNHESFGPQLPPHMPSAIILEDISENNNKHESFGPQLPPHMLTHHHEILDNKYTIPGPLPIIDKCDIRISDIELSKRALEIKNKNEFPKTNLNTDTREEWMIELPEIKKPTNLPTSFQSKNRPDFSDRTSWTDTPSNSSVKKKSSYKEKYKNNVNMEREKEQDLLAKKCNTKLKKSLLELHKEKMKLEKMKKNKTKEERRPFNKDIDMQHTKFESKKSLPPNTLSDKYSTGTRKYL